jgi:hypothetical protein
VARAISERHEIVVETDESTFVLTADSRDGRLVIQQRRKGGADKGREVCSLSLANPSELEAFFDGLRRVLASTGLGPGAAGGERAATHTSGRFAPPPDRQSAGGTRERDEDVVARARGRNANAFEPWTASEEEDVRRRFEGGERVEAIARAHNRSPKAIQMRLERLGVMPRH